MSKNNLFMITLFLCIVYFLTLYFLPSWLINADNTDLAIWYPNYAGVIKLYVRIIYPILPLIILILLTISIFTSKAYLYSILLKFFRKIINVKNVIYYIATISVTLAIFNINFYPSISFPQLHTMYKKNKVTRTLTFINRRFYLESNRKEIDLRELQHPLEIHNYLYLKRYTMDEKTLKNSITYIESKVGETIYYESDTVIKIFN